MSDHAARPLPAPASGKPGVEPIYVKPFACAVCGKPIEHRGAGAWRHVKNLSDDVVIQDIVV